MINRMKEKQFFSYILETVTGRPIKFIEEGGMGEGTGKHAAI